MAFFYNSYSCNDKTILVACTRIGRRHAVYGAVLPLRVRSVRLVSGISVKTLPQASWDLTDDRPGRLVSPSRPCRRYHASRLVCVCVVTKRCCVFREGNEHDEDKSHVCRTCSIRATTWNGEPPNHIQFKSSYLDYLLYSRLHLYESPLRHCWLNDPGVFREACSKVIGMQFFKARTLVEMLCSR